MTRRGRGRRTGWLPFVYTSALALSIDCSLPQNQTELALCSAPSIDFVKQTKLASLSLSQCLTPWPATTPNPKPLETQTPVNHPTSGYQDIKAHSSTLLPPTCILLFSSAPFAPLFV